MTIGTGLVLVAVGAILRYAVTDSIQGIDLTTIGLILMVVGVVGFVIGLFQEFGRRDRNVGEYREYREPPGP